MAAEQYPRAAEFDMSYEVDQTPAAVSWQGRLDGGLVDHEVWRGKISAEAIHPQKKGLEQYREIVNDYYTVASPNMPVRCIDGRPRKGVLSSDQAEIRSAKLGPQVPGGSPAMALSLRVAEFDSIDPRSITIIDDLINIKGRFDELDLPFPIGNHEDDHAKSPDTGCGAIDRMPDILQHMSNPQAAETMIAYARSIVGKDFEDQALADVQERLRLVNEPEFIKKYLMLDDLGVYHYKELTLETVKDMVGDHAAEEVEGQHKEAFIVVNTMPGQTFNRDLFCLDSGNEVQSFNYDYWHSLERANRLFSQEPEVRARFLITRAMYAASTAMVLTDGSIELGIRQPAAE